MGSLCFQPASSTFRMSLCLEHAAVNCHHRGVLFQLRVYHDLICFSPSVLSLKVPSHCVGVFSAREDGPVLTLKGSRAAVAAGRALIQAVSYPPNGS